MVLRMPGLGQDWMTCRSKSYGVAGETTYGNRSAGSNPVLYAKQPNVMLDRKHRSQAWFG
jgi:hypothetical protein